MTPGRKLLGELIAEMIALVIIIMVGDSVAAMYLLYDPSPYLHSYWGVAMSWGLGVTMAIYVTGSVSGCHANPAVTLALALYRGFPWPKVLPYMAAQVLGGVVGAAIVYLLFWPVIDHFNAAHHLTRAGDGGGAGVFFTHPGKYVGVLHCLVDQVVLTGFLVLGIFAITETRNEMAPMANVGALMIGLLVAVIGASMGYLEAWAISPARDLGPRIFCWIAGWGAAAFPSPRHYWWVPIAGPLLGGVVGGGLYQGLIHPFLPRKPDSGMPQRISPDAAAGAASDADAA
ncbi:MAG: aquaporin family protein [Gluconacetobacter diazotrophicus]|nr:aquaporin family protein [Gluconacetobacter diazotrophicus]